LTLTTQIRTGRILVLASFLALLPSSTFPTESENRRAEAQTAFERATRLRTELETEPQDTRKKADYEKVVQAFKSVYRLNPAASKSPEALEAEAEVREEMGGLFSSKRYFLNAIRTYEFLNSQYPYNRLAREALYAIGEIYRTDLEKPEEARKAFEKYLEQNPKSPKAAELREWLGQSDQTLQSQRRKPVVDVAGDVMGPVIPNVDLGGTENQCGKSPCEVTAIRRWVGPNYTRIVITVAGEVRFDASRLAHPDRIVFDLSNSRPGSALAGQPFAMEDGYLREIRVARFKPEITRIVLDVKQIEDYSVFTLPNPFRLVIDIHGASVPPPSGTEPVVVAEKANQAKPPNSEKPVAPATDETSSSLKSKNPVGPTAPGGSIGGARTLAKSQGPEKEPTKESGGLARVAGKTEPRPTSSLLEKAAAKPPSLASSSAAGLVGTPLGESPLAALPAEPTESGSRTLTRALGLKIGRVVIDPGHGGHDTGTIGPTGLTEKDLVVDVGLRLKKLVEGNTASEVVMTRSDDTFVPLEERTAIANQKAADLFVSIHANASSDKSARGVETYYLNFTSSPDALEVAARENATTQESVHQLGDLIKKIAMTEKIEESHELAKQVQQVVHTSLNKAGGKQKDRGVKKAPFVVLIGANMPSILAEISFLTNPRDERLLKRPEYRQRIAEALYQGIARYMNTLGRVKVAQQLPHQERIAAGSPNF
jgi:N-acetylmuramoyl-L-alanine amidase